MVFVCTAAVCLNCNFFVDHFFVDQLTQVKFIINLRTKDSKCMSLHLDLFGKLLQHVSLLR